MACNDRERDRGKHARSAFLGRIADGGSVMLKRDWETRPRAGKFAQNFRAMNPFPISEEAKMPRGGARLGAGRPKKGEIRPSKPSVAPIEGAIAFAFLAGAIQDEALPFESRLKAAATLLPFETRRVPSQRPLGLRAQAAESAKAAAVDIYAVPPSPPRLRALGDDE